MPKHTPGPWRVGDAGTTVFGPPNGMPAPDRIASMANRGEHTKPNAHLIAAAPDLLAACEAATLALANIGKPGMLSAAQHTLRAAIARATGEASSPLVAPRTGCAACWAGPRDSVDCAQYNVCGAS